MSMSPHMCRTIDACGTEATPKTTTTMGTTDLRPRLAGLATGSGLINSEASDWRTHSMSGFNTLGADATVTLIVTDVGETDRTSAVSVDNLRVE